MGVPLPERISKEETQSIWEECIQNFEQYLKDEVHNNSDNGSQLNSFRQEISDSCRQAAETDQKLYRLIGSNRSGKNIKWFAFCVISCEKDAKAANFLYSAI